MVEPVLNPYRSRRRSPTRITSGSPERIDDAFSDQSRSTWRAISAGEAPGPAKRAAIDHSVSPLLTT